MRKKEELQTRGSCINKAADDEPVFVLRAQDRFAALTVRFWATMLCAARIGRTYSMDPERTHKETEAFQIADQMDSWRKTHGGGKIPD